MTIRKEEIKDCQILKSGNNYKGTVATKNNVNNARGIDDYYKTCRLRQYIFPLSATTFIAYNFASICIIPYQK